MAGSVGGSSTDDSKPVCSDCVSELEKRKAKENASTALVIPSPPLLSGRDDSRICRDVKNCAWPRISSRRLSVRVVSKVRKGGSMSGSGGWSEGGK